MQCMVRGQDPKNFQVMVPAEQSLVARLISRAEELLAEGRAIACPASLSARQREVLNAVLSNRANKEIASKLNITVRTVKFHVSSLLSKFGVESRADLARRAAGFMRPDPVDDGELPEAVARHAADYDHVDLTGPAWGLDQAEQERAQVAILEQMRGSLAAVT